MKALAKARLRERKELDPQRLSVARSRIAMASVNTALRARDPDGERTS